jgi:hypothetical protein
VTGKEDKEATIYYVLCFRFYTSPVTGLTKVCRFYYPTPLTAHKEPPTLTPKKFINEEYLLVDCSS